VPLSTFVDLVFGISFSRIFALYISSSMTCNRERRELRKKFGRIRCLPACGKVEVNRSSGIATFQMAESSGDFVPIFAMGVP
jgi:hypothetical protein